MTRFLRTFAAVMGLMTIALMVSLITAGDIPLMPAWKIKLAFGFGLVCGALCFALGLFVPKPTKTFSAER